MFASRYPKLTNWKTVEGEQPPSPVGWDQRIYQVQPGHFRFNKTTIELSPELFLEEIDLVIGSIRVDGCLEKDRLQIGVYESENYKLLGYSGSPHICTVSYSGSRWDAVAAGPSRGITFNAGPEITKHITSCIGSSKLQHHNDKDGANDALLLSVNAEIAMFANAMKQVFRLLKNIDLEAVDRLQFEWIKEDLIGLACVAIDKLFADEDVEILNLKTRRRSIAHSIEDELWKEPIDTDEIITMEYFMERFNCSRRQIQLSVDEHFGISFTALKRLIRLHQFNNSVASKGNGRKISDLAFKYEFEHLGRFSGYYKEMFGKSPRQALTKFRLADD